MMTGLEESWARTREHLARARSKLPACPISGDEGGSIAAFEEYLDHNELQLALSELELLETANQVPFSFWKHMQYVAEEMGLVEEIDRYTGLCLKLPLSPDWVGRLTKVVSSHPLYQEAENLAYCVGPEFILFDRTLTGTSKLPEGTKQRLMNLLEQSEIPIICMLFFTASTEPQPLADYGDMYAFFFNSESLEIVATDVSGWRL